MIEYRTGNLLSNKSGFIVHGCNAQGVMGAGVAKSFREKFPEAFARYQFDLVNQLIKVGQNSYHTAWDDQTPIILVSAITQEFFGKDSTRKYVSYDAIDSCFRELTKKIKDDSNPRILDRTIHIPKLGAGLGGGNWEVISAIIEDTTEGLDVVCWTL